MPFSSCFRTMGISVGSPPKFYNAFPNGKPDEFFEINKHADILDKAEENIQKGDPLSAELKNKAVSLIQKCKIRFK